MTTAASEQETRWAEEKTKPPFLRRVRIRGYKSIAFCDVRLQPLTILVGRNGSIDLNPRSAAGPETSD